jgi:hypothetical protein
MSSLPKTGKTVAEFATSVGISPAQVYIEMGSGRLKGKKLGRRTIILAEDEAAWLAALPPAVIKPRVKRGATSKTEAA